MEAYLDQFLHIAPSMLPFAFVLARAIAIIIPPIPGVLVDTAGVALFPWWLGFLLAEVGLLLGGCVAFLLARLLREPLVRRVAPLKAVETWEAQYSEQQKFWTLVMLRLVSNSAFDYISYAAGLTKLSFRSFFLSSLLGTIPSLLIFYALGGAVVNFLGPWVAASIGVVASIIVLTQFGKIGESINQVMGTKKATPEPPSSIDTRSGDS